MAHERRSDLQDRARRWPRGLLLALLALLAGPPALLGEEAKGEPAVEELERAVAQGARRIALFGGLTDDAPPPWAVEAPGAAKARFGLGLETFFEHQESLRITAREGTIRVRDLASGLEESGFLPDDAALLNRKFDLLWEATGLGVALPVALPDLELGAGRLYPSLVFEAAAADVSLDFRDRTVAAESTSLSGTGTLFGAGFDLTAALCRDCPWFAAAGYRLRKLPRFAVDRSPPFGPQGLQVLEDEVRLEREAQEVSTRAGYVFAGGRLASWVGVLHRRTDLEVEDELRYRDRATETHLSSRTRLESEATLGLAGLDAYLGPRLRGRLETSVGEEDYGVRLGVVYLYQRSGERAPDGELSDERASEIAAQIEDIRTDFVSARSRLPVEVGPGGIATYPLDAVLRLLALMELRLLEAMSGPELAVLRATVRNRFRLARESLAPVPGAGASPSSKGLGPSIVPASWSAERSLASRWSLAQVAERVPADSVLDTVADFAGRVLELLRNNDLRVDVCIKTSPKGAVVRIRPVGFERIAKLKSNDSRRVDRGDYVYHVELDGYEEIDCFRAKPNAKGCERLDFVGPDSPLVTCQLNPSRPGECIFGDDRSAQKECR